MDRQGSRVVVEAGRRSGRPVGSGHAVGERSRPSAGHDAVGRSGRRAGRRSKHAAEEYDGGSHRDAGCSREEDRDGRSSRRVVGRSRGHGSRASESGSAHEDEESRFEA